MTAGKTFTPASSHMDSPNKPFRGTEPLLTIIIPTCNRPKQLTACIEALANQNYPHEAFEVIVVDDGSDRPLHDVVAAFNETLNIRLFIQQNAGPATARNLGATQAKGRFLAFTDDDCKPANDWLQKFALRFENLPDCAIGGQTLNALPDNIYSAASQLLNDYLYIYYNANHHQAQFFTSNNLAVPKDRFHSVGGFDNSYSRAAGEDRDFCNKWLHSGYDMIYAPEARVYHAHRLTFQGFWRQQVNYGRGAFLFYQTRRMRNDCRPGKLETKTFYWQLLQYPFLKRQGVRSFLLGMLFVMSQLAITSGYVLEKMTTSKR